MPSSLLEERAWLRSLGVGMQTLFMVCGVSGSSDLAELDAAGRVARYELGWKPTA